MDLNKEEIEKAVEVLAKIAQINRGAYTFFYFAGHGFAHLSEQYLQPIDGTIEDCTPETAVRVKKLQNRMYDSCGRFHWMVFECGDVM